MAVTNSSAQFNADISRYLDDKVLRLAQRHLVLRQFATKLQIPEGEGQTYTATRFNRLPLPYAPLSEGVPPVGETVTISQVTGVALQWGDKVTVTDVANLTIKHPVFQQAIRLLGYQVSELYERNLMVQLTSGVQVNYVNSRGARANLVAGDVLDPTTVNRTFSDLDALGAPMMLGPQETDVRKDIEDGPRRAGGKPLTSEHLVAVAHPYVLNDFRQNATVVNAWSYSDINKLYINEVGYWAGIHFTKSNLIPSWTGIAAVTGTAGTSGSLATGTYYVQVTGSDVQNQYESQIYQVSSGIAVTGPSGSISVTVPATVGYTYSVYVGTSSAPMNIGASSSAAVPTTGPYAGQAVQIAPGSTVVISSLGLMQVPPAAPATGVTVYPTFIFGEDAFACLELDKLQWTRLTEADKSDPLNQLRVIGWKGWDGTVITNQQFMARIESSASNSGAFG
jgi:N4-gp56 family major capsid protein